MDFKLLLEKQKHLDNVVMYNITDEQIEEKFKGELDFIKLYNYRKEALRMEISEFVNELAYFKYWKKKKECRMAILEEAADVLHFIFSLEIMCRSKKELEENRFIYNIGLCNRIYKSNEELIDRLFYCLNGFDGTSFRIFSDSITTLQVESYINSVCLETLLAVLSRYGITEEELEKEYHRKNNINLIRQSEGY